jgi:hypothetical protein
VSAEHPILRSISGGTPGVDARAGQRFAIAVRSQSCDGALECPAVPRGDRTSA